MTAHASPSIDRMAEPIRPEPLLYEEHLIDQRIAFIQDALHHQSTTLLAPFLSRALPALTLLKNGEALRQDLYDLVQKDKISLEGLNGLVQEASSQLDAEAGALTVHVAIVICVLQHDDASRWFDRVAHHPAELFRAAFEATTASFACHTNLIAEAPFSETLLCALDSAFWLRNWSIVPDALANKMPFIKIVDILPGLTELGQFKELWQLVKQYSIPLCEMALSHPHEAIREIQSILVQCDARRSNTSPHAEWRNFMAYEVAILLFINLSHDNPTAAENAEKTVKAISPTIVGRPGMDVEAAYLEVQDLIYPFLLFRVAPTRDTSNSGREE